MIKNFLFKMLAFFCMASWIIMFPLIELALKLTGRSDGIKKDWKDLWYFVRIIAKDD